jgi:hypothetical protein
MRRSLSLLLVLSFAAAPANAQQTSRTITPGMSRAQVIAALGAPLTLRESDGFTYIFYRNQCTRACGMNDLVVLHADSVVDAIFRSPDRHYSGSSSSPEMIPARVAAHGKNAAVHHDTTGGKLRIKPAPPSDVHPSIPANPPKLKPAPTQPKKP